MRYQVRVGERTLLVEIRDGQMHVDGRRVAAALRSIDGTPLRQLTVDGACCTVAITRAGTAWAVQADGETLRVEVVDERVQHLREVAGAAGAGASGETIRAPMPGLVLRVETQPGDPVTPGDGVVVLEAMKMENEIRAATAGIVREVFVTAGAPVEKGAPLVRIGPAD